MLSIPCFDSFYSADAGDISRRTIVSMLWQKIALPTPLQKFLKPLKQHRDSVSSSCKIYPSFDQKIFCVSFFVQRIGVVFGLDTILRFLSGFFSLENRR